MIISLVLSPAGKGFERFSEGGEEAVNRWSVVQSLQQLIAKNGLKQSQLIIAPGVTDDCASHA
ncbi:hypothetical protein M3I53_11655 [Paraburkholderia sp. CNPSo 3272]|uniref:hypothetical protein n=1 Tax=Paraburkholderia sp. CNPSo 3272 TaxID=2940931 RepID=UPI0020B7A02A|nr:hypothetical protein [Paraburkholderia sp. CNPSo 3272]MCP3723776.1 hypothetical protein [Paraburkholderia sp. CNPSo 3272]